MMHLCVVHEGSSGSGGGGGARGECVRTSNVALL